MATPRKRSPRKKKEAPVIKEEEEVKKEDEQRTDPMTQDQPTSQKIAPIGTIGIGTTSSTMNPGRTPKEGLAAKLAGGESTCSAPHVMVKALAGTGKTTTVVEGMKVVKGLPTTITPSPQQAAVWEQMKLGKSDTIRFNAFGKAIATELQARMEKSGLDKKGCEASTFHSLGCRAVNKALGRMDLSNFIVQDMVAAAMGGDARELKKEPSKLITLNATEELVSLCKQNMLNQPDHEELEQLTSHYDIDLGDKPGEVYDLTAMVLEKCKSPKKTINFDDMVWLPAVLELPIPKSDVLIVDEAQDLNRMQQALAYRAGHRIIFVGDIHQAIYGFAGADADSMPRMQRELSGGHGCVVIPLTVTRRCGKAIVREAQRYVPEYEAHESNCEGLVGNAKWPVVKTEDERRELPWEETYGPLVKPGDFVLCRVNAPLVSQCFRFLKRGIKANIQGRDVAKGLISTITKSKKELVPQLVGWLSDWRFKETEKENAKRNPSEAKLTAIQDRYECLVCFTDGLSTVTEVLAKINTVFTDDKVSPGIKFSSIHKSKGLEAHRVFLLQPPGVGPRTDKMKPWEREQEDNLKYVAITRAIEELTYVR